MHPKILLLTPPFTQLNTPYPATAYLKGFLQTKGYAVHQADLGIEVILALFSKNGLQTIFEKLENSNIEISENSYRIYALREEYLSTIDPVVAFLQYKNPTLAHSICTRNYLPEAARFQQISDLEWAFGTMGVQDKARHLATLYLEDLGDLITEAIDPWFGFSRYAERLGQSTTHFDELDAALKNSDTIITQLLEGKLKELLKKWQPDVVGFSVPFPGNLFGALKAGQYLKKNHPNIKIVMGGGYPNTELRSLRDERVFNYVDFISLDDGEAPLLSLLEYLEGKREKRDLKRMFGQAHGVVSYHNGAKELDIPQRETGTPDYRDLPLDKYLSVIEITNPMHRLWNDGRWNKLTLAHGCYWGKCSFCDVTLDYIQRYEPLTAALLCDRIEEIIEQTGQTGFHFVDEAAPPALMRDLAIEIIRRKLTISWWTNIRFEKSFTADLCQLLAASGCIAVSGGLEVASDRLLTLMKKGVTVAQVAKVAENFNQAGILVHAYLMYGFPTQSEQETIDSLEMVRQMFDAGVLQSGFWHRFAMTAHSPVGINPAAFQVEMVGPAFGGFAENDLFHEDPTGAEHELFETGLRKSLFNYMNGVGLEMDLQEWFDFEVPETSIEANYIERCLQEEILPKFRPNQMVLWLEKAPTIQLYETRFKGKRRAMAELFFYAKTFDFQLQIQKRVGEWLHEIIPQLIINKNKPLTIKAVQTSYEKAGLGDFEELLFSKLWQQLREHGLLIV